MTSFERLNVQRSNVRLILENAGRPHLEFGISAHPVEPQRHGGHREGTEPDRPPTSQPRRHQGTKAPRDSRSPTAHPFERKGAKTGRRKEGDAGRGALPLRGGRTAGDRIACRRWEAGGLRTRAFVVAALRTGSRARGTAVLPLALPRVTCQVSPSRCVFAPLRGRWGGPALLLCVLGWVVGLRDFLVSWWLRRGWVVGNPKSEIRNSKSSCGLLSDSRTSRMRKRGRGDPPCGASSPPICSPR